MPNDKDILRTIHNVEETIRGALDDLQDLRAQLATKPVEPKKPTNPWEGWVWPMRVVGFNFPPVISDGFKLVKTETTRQHLGVDICYKRNSAGDTNLPHASKWFFCPKDVPVVACGSGTLWSAGISERGHWVVIDHGETPAGKLTSFYTHLESFSKDVQSFYESLRGWKAYGRRGSRPYIMVKAGDQLGICGDDPSAVDLRHLHMELKVWTAAGVGKQIDPEPLLKQWKVLD